LGFKIVSGCTTAASRTRSFAARAPQGHLRCKNELTPS
jgi:hypothetical protein